jgi:ferrous-iron efflux pump FieF
MNNNTLIKITSITSIFMMSLLIVVKFVAYSKTDSLAILSSLIDSALDGTMSLINYFAIMVALRPKDDQYRFGYNAIEDIVGLVQASFIFGSATFMIIHSITRLIDPKPLMNNSFGISITLISIFATSMVYFLQLYTIKRTKSIIISVDAMHYQMDIMINVGLLLSLILIAKTDILYIDPIVSILISIYMLCSSFGFGKVAFGNLMSKELTDDIKNKIIDIISRYNEIKGYHNLKTRQSGNMKFIQIHIELDKNMSFMEAHDISHKLEEDIEKDIQDCEIVIHKDPI